MFYKDWKPIYQKIAKDLNFQEENDKLAADVLNQLLQNNKIGTLKKIEKMINEKEVIVCGAGPSLERSLIIYKEKLADMLKISADGATSALLKNNILPDIIITDLDGKVTDQLKANSQGSIAIIHAHGDNISNIKRYVPEFKGDILGSTQINSNSYKNIYNFGGFTDGDRAVFLAEHFHAKMIYLIGFNFDGKIGRYSFSDNKNKSLKLKKLKWCEYLIELIKKKKQNIYNLKF